MVFEVVAVVINQVMRLEKLLVANIFWVRMESGHEGWSFLLSLLWHTWIVQHKHSTSL